MRFTPRFSLRTLMILVVIVVVAVPSGQALWRRYVLRQDAAAHLAIMATKADFIVSQAEEDTSFAIDQGRPIPDDFVVLVRKGDVFGRFIPHKQHQTTESLEYDWYYREDREGRFDADHPAVRKGRSKSRAWVPNGKAVTVDFGPFSIKWSGHGPGLGFLYYDYSKDRDLNNVVAICTTDRKSVEYLDARDGQWRYRAYVGHEGVAGNVDVQSSKRE